jgi:hypothetical protein
MRTAGKDSGPTPHALGALAGTVVLAVGVGLAAYFIEVRGTGIRVEWMSGHGPELGIVAGALVAASLAAHLAIVNLAQRLRSTSRHRQLLHHALEVDYADPEVLRRFDVIPDLRELVGLIASEKAQSREQSDRIETLRGELRGLVEGMQRSAVDFVRMREEGSSELRLLAVATWNSLLERTRIAEAALADSEKARASLESAAATTDMAGEDTVFAEPEPLQAAAADDSHLTTLVTRLDELEGELERLRSLTATSSRPSLEAAPAAAPRWPEPSRVAPGLASVVPAPEVSFDDLEVSPTVRAWTGPKVPPVGPAEAEEMHFPHFVGRPAGAIPDRIEVSYESTDDEPVMELPSSALLFEDEAAIEEPVIDLRQLGALELDR